LTKEIQQAIVNVEESKVSKNAVGPLRNEFETVGGGKTRPDTNKRLRQSLNFKKP